jgi:hypothetical protein
MHISKWSARRSGPSMTIKGTDESGKSVTLTNVKLIETRGRLVVAIGEPLSGNARSEEHILRTDH